MGVPNSWMVYKGNPIQKWMITSGTPMTQETSIYLYVQVMVIYIYITTEIPFK